MIDRTKILSMAKQVLGGDYTENGHWPFFIEELEQYTALVVKAAADAEREACAVEAEKLDCAMRCGVGSEVAATLRARGAGGEA